jgi:hypothetical protein
MALKLTSNYGNGNRLSRINGNMGAQIVETFQPVIGFRKFLDDSD